MKRLLFLIIIVALVSQVIRHSHDDGRGFRPPVPPRPPHAPVIAVRIDSDGHRIVEIGRNVHRIKTPKIKAQRGQGRVVALNVGDTPSTPVPPVPPQGLDSLPSTVFAVETQTPAPPEACDSPAPPATLADASAADPEAAPAWFQHDGSDSDAAKQTDPRGLRTIKGKQSATEQRADASAQTQLDRAVSDWLAPEVPRTWKTPRQTIDSIVLDRHVEPVNHDDLVGILYVTGYRADFSPARRAQIVEAYHHELVVHRLLALGGGLGFVLICLGALSGYIRADEATKGYYTNRLRLAAAVGVGAAGMALYRVLV